MVYKRKQDGMNMIQAGISDELARQVEEALDGDPELTESQLVREGLRRELQDHEVREAEDNE